MGKLSQYANAIDDLKAPPAPPPEPVVDHEGSRKRAIAKQQIEALADITKSVSALGKAMPEPKEVDLAGVVKAITALQRSVAAIPKAEPAPDLTPALEKLAAVIQDFLAQDVAPAPLEVPTITYDIVRDENERLVRITSRPYREPDAEPDTTTYG